MKPLHKFFIFTVAVCLSFVSLKAQELKMNQMQVIGSHNSYKIGIEKPLMDLIVSQNPEAIGLAYTHIPLTQQLDLGLRSLEIDVVYDPEGGRFSHPKGLDMLTSMGLEPEPYNAETMNEPGFKVLHVPDIDFRSHCPTFKGCLSDIRDWSQSHSDHLPIIITINPKISGLERPGFAEVLPFDRKVLDALDGEILEIFNDSELVTPKQVKGKQATLRKAIIDKGWPDLAKVRGKILFVFDAGNELTELYMEGDENYARPMFSSTNNDNPHAALFIMNDPVKQEKQIAELVKQGFMVRTRSDADTREARTGDKTRFEAATRSGAQVITTDYYLKSLSPDKDFEIIFVDGRYQRCNPVLTNSSTCDLP
ncbi:phosphatidylinositol-specific phospholipase C1-like protein [uncultured Imperialibacter sp.]|uniref:phosphatidylinositol-specific phospholipase C1-like protein n=1 Tax=uncultured Imperialibacter sp. TaxID=1672639 RepID=UPI0030D997A0|tara:strand:+ start:5605 stop:6702 length:1098 start_codon:yes stop_codon:yes gene_type:complete